MRFEPKTTGIELEGVVHNHDYTTRSTQFEWQTASFVRTGIFVVTLTSIFETHLSKPSNIYINLFVYDQTQSPLLDHSIDTHTLQNAGRYKQTKRTFYNKAYLEPAESQGYRHFLQLRFEDRTIGLQTHC